MRIKSLVVSILVLMSCAAVAAQTNAVAGARANAAALGGRASAQSNGEAGSDTGTPAPALKAEDLLKIRDVQYRHAQRAARMKAIEQEYSLLKTAQDADGQKVDAIITTAARDAKVDLAEWAFDIEGLRFIPREKPATKPSPKK